MVYIAKQYTMMSQAMLRTLYALLYLDFVFFSYILVYMGVLYTVVFSRTQLWTIRFCDFMPKIRKNA